MQTTEDAFVRADEVGELLGIGKSKAYQMVRQCNDELAKMGYIVIRGRCPRRYFEKKIYGLAESSVTGQSDLKTRTMNSKEQQKQI